VRPLNKIPRNTASSPARASGASELSKQLSQLDSDLENTRRRKIELDAEIQNLTRAVADGMDSPSLRKAITEREAEISQLTAKTLGRGKDSVHSQVRNLRKFVQSAMGDLRRLLTSNGSASLVRMALAKHIGAITVGPDDAGSIAYKGEFKLLGDECVSWDGAEGQNRTGYAGLFRAALYQ
jgi:cell division protein FtsB